LTGHGRWGGAATEPHHSELDAAVRELEAAQARVAAARRRLGIHAVGAGSIADLPENLDLLAAIANHAAFAVVVTDRAVRVRWANEAFARLTGYAVSDVLGRHPGAVLQGPDTDPASVAEMRRAIRAGEPFDVVVLNYRASGEQYWVRIEGYPVVASATGEAGYIAIESDVTPARVAAGREAVLRDVADRLVGSSTPEDAARAVTQALASVVDVRAAQVWLVEPNRDTLRHVAGASADRDGVGWLDVSASMDFRAGDAWIVGVGAPGMAWGTAGPCVKSDFWERDRNGQRSRRAAAAQRARIRTVCAVPVLGPEGVVGVVEVGGSHRYPGHEGIPDLVGQVARLLASFLARARSERAFSLIFERSPDGLLIVDPGGTVRRANPAARKLFGEVSGGDVDALFDGGLGMLAGDWETGPEPERRRGRSPDGQTFSAEVLVSELRGGPTAARIVSVRDLTVRHAAEKALARSLEAKVLLVQEVHHRVKNNLQIISSLLSLQSAKLESDEARQALDATIHRIRSIAEVHRQLYASGDVSSIRLDAYVDELARSLHASMASGARVIVDAAPVTVSLLLAVPCGLVLNELLTNAFKYGLGANGQGEVRVLLREVDSEIVLSVSDDGAGFREGEADRSSIGHLLVRGLTGQLRARMHVDCSAGTTVTITVPRAS
jgi:PAS domain S-box-containing protein